MTQYPGGDFDAELLECERQSIRFMADFDAQRYEQACALFAPDGVWHRPDGDIHGRENFLSRMAQRPRGLLVRHVMTNLRSRRIDQDTICVESYVTVYRYDFEQEISYPAALAGPAVMGRYTDVLKRIGGVWVIHDKSVSIDFKR